MRRFRFVLPFVLGAASMLAVVVAAEWALPGVMESVLRDPASEAPSSGSVPRPGPEAVPADRVEPAAGASSMDRPAPMPPPRASSSAAAASAAGAGGAARLLIPVQGVQASSLADTYEDARGEGRRHDAMDIMAPRGTPVLAAADGVVMKLFESERGGTTLYQLAPDQRTIYYYAHLDGYAPGMVEGRALRRGEVLGYVGDTGDAGAGNYHLHFEVSTTHDPEQYWGGIPQNPYPLMR